MMNRFLCHHYNRPFMCGDARIFQPGLYGWIAGHFANTVHPLHFSSKQAEAEWLADTRCHYQPLSTTRK